MDQTSTGLTNAKSALVLNGGLANAALSESPTRQGLSHGPAALQLPAESTGGNGHRSERLLTLLVALEALRAAPEALAAGRATPKV
jgi:hypothetical protein